MSLRRNSSACCGMVLVNPPTMMANSNSSGAGWLSRSAASSPVRAAPWLKDHHRADRRSSGGFPGHLLPLLRHQGTGCPVRRPRAHDARRDGRAAADLPVLTAPHRAIRYGLAQLERHDEQERRELIAAVPELRIAQLDDIRRTVELLAGAVAGRIGRPPGDFEIRVFTGALTGAVLAALDDDAQDPARLDNIRQAIDYLGTGFPLAAVSGRLQGPHHPQRDRR